MLNWLLTNLGTIIVSIALILIVAGVIFKLIRDKKKGGCAGCTCGCSSEQKENCGK